MEEYIIVGTTYGDVKLVKRYDTDSCREFYDAYDEAENHLGLIWESNLEDEENEYLTNLVEDCIDDGTLAIPLSKEPTTDKVWIATICICKYGKALAYSEAFKTQDNALNYRQNELEKWIKDSGVEIDPIQTMSSGVFMEMSDEIRNLIFTATIKETEIK